MSEPEVCYEAVENDLNKTRIRIIGARAVWAAWAQHQAGEAAAYADSVEAGGHEWRSLQVIDDALRRAETELETALRLLDEITGPDEPASEMAGGTGVTTAEIPKLTFDHHAYGVEVDWFGEDGGMCARGHIPDLRFIAACNHLARSVGWRNILDSYSATLDEVLVHVTRVWATPIAPPGGSEWGIYYARGNTAPPPGGIPMTLLVSWRQHLEPFAPGQRAAAVLSLALKASLVPYPPRPPTDQTRPWPYDDPIGELRWELGARTRQYDQVCRDMRALTEEVISALSTAQHRMTLRGGLPFCACGLSLGGGDASGAFITHILAAWRETRR